MELYVPTLDEFLLVLRYLSHFFMLLLHTIPCFLLSYAYVFSALLVHFHHFALFHVISIFYCQFYFTEKLWSTVVMIVFDLLLAPGKTEEDDRRDQEQFKDFFIYNVLVVGLSYPNCSKRCVLRISIVRII